ncbi:hypothetical protein K431DRAFT_286763 [Polychaeton citri CBS 116435]|uniref:SAP domain-containing protein n=1 Tax=Polychaeton citri CBS 116435 TaxID=1314669 RepID=A0A9P4Q6Y3_9PEZI|nr:hypothetical protein K431DRAFT_286763 [Polychaeton citri CBS 116435]
MSYSDLKVNELRQLLKDRGIPSTGLTRKAQIVEELERNDAAKTEGGNELEEQSSSEREGLEGAIDDVGAETDPTEAPEQHDMNGAGATDHTTTQTRDGTSEEEVTPDTSGKLESEDIGEQSLAQEYDASTYAEQPSTAAISPQHSQAEEAALPVAETPTEPMDVVQPATLADEVSPLEGSATPEAIPADSRKRKRRSITPPPTEENIKKKLKAAGENVAKLAETDGNETFDQPPEIKQDTVIGDAPVPVEKEEQDEAQHNTAIPASTSGDARYVDDPKLDTGRDVTMEDDDTDVPPALHPATRALYISNLLRPIQKPTLESHLITLSTPADSSSDPGALDELHLDSLKTHAFARFTTIAAASRVRSRLHGRIWPNEGTRKPLEIDFIPESKMSEWIDVEGRDSGRRGDAKRWEVVYEDNADGDVNAELREVLLGSLKRQGSGFGGRDPSFHAEQQGAGMPGAPLGPRSDGRKHPGQAATAGPANYDRAPTKPVAKTAAFLDLDSRFPSTNSKPKLYFLPVDKELANRRFDAFDADTSREWDGNTDGGGPGGQLRRYTFEDGDRIVDGGVDFGHFGRNKVGGDRFRPGGRRGGRGR